MLFSNDFVLLNPSPKSLCEVGVGLLLMMGRLLSKKITLAPFPQNQGNNFKKDNFFMTIP